MPDSLSAHSSAHASLPQFGPVRSSTTPGRSHAVTFQIHLQHKIRRAEPHCWKGAVFPFHATSAKHNRPMGKWVHDQFRESSKSPLLCSLYGKKVYCSFQKKKKKTDQREWPPQHTEKRGSNCSVEWSQSISSPSRAHGAANEPGDRPGNQPQRLKSVDKPPAQWETEQTNIWSSNESMETRNKNK